MNEADFNAGIERAAQLCRVFEGFYSEPYLCPAGVPTIGFGTTHYEDGTAVTLNDPPITRERANELLLDQLRHLYVRKTFAMCPTVETPDQLGALSDFSYNLGTSRLKASTLRRRVLERAWEAAKVEIGKWVKGGGRVLRGLVLRRQAEAALLST